MADGSLPPEQRRVKEEFVQDRGFWAGLFDELLFLRPEYPARYGKFSAHPGDVLDRQTKELVHIAVDCSTTHLYHRGTRAHINYAFNNGVTVDEILDVFILASTVGIRSSAAGAGLVAEAVEGAENDDINEELKAEFRERLGYWSEDLEALLRLDDEHFAQYFELMALPWEEGVLEPKVREFVLLAIEIAPTRHNEDAARHHVENALEHGATVEEVMSVIETASVIGVHTMDSMVILTEEAARRGKLPESLTDNPEYLSFRDPYEL
jgi:alkylhydroperoxidase/carboxymuconolactone decarboxylase family protein YurZ